MRCRPQALTCRVLLRSTVWCVVSATDLRLTYCPALDGLRGVAVLAIVLYHLNVAWLPGGFLGVDAFLLLSGFLITSLLLREWARGDGIDLKRFWTRTAGIARLSGILDGIALESPSVQTLDLSPIVCHNAVGCDPYVDGIRVRDDGNHFTDAMAAFVAPEIIAAIVSSLDGDADT